VGELNAPLQVISPMFVCGATLLLGGPQLSASSTRWYGTGRLAACGCEVAVVSCQFGAGCSNV